MLSWNAYCRGRHEQNVMTKANQQSGAISRAAVGVGDFGAGAAAIAAAAATATLHREEVVDEAEVAGVVATCRAQPWKRLVVQRAQQQTYPSGDRLMCSTLSNNQLLSFCRFFACDSKKKR